MVENGGPMFTWISTRRNEPWSNCKDLKLGTEEKKKKKKEEKNLAISLSAASQACSVPAVKIGYMGTCIF